MRRSKIILVMEYKALALTQISNDTFVNADTFCPIHKGPYEATGKCGSTCPNYDNALVTDIEKIPTDYFLIMIIHSYSRTAEEIIQKIEKAGIYKKKCEVNYRPKLYFINIFKYYDYDIHNIYPEIKGIKDLPYLEGIQNRYQIMDYDEINYPCVVNSIDGDIGLNEDLSVNFSFKPLTAPNANHKIFIMDRRKHQTKSATKKNLNNNID